MLKLFTLWFVCMNELALFAGAGGGILGGILLGWRTVCAVEINAYCAQVLMQRQNDGHLSPFPIWDDVRTFDGRPWRGIVDVVSGGFPCQDISAAGKGGGIDGERSGLWAEFARIIGEVRPQHVLVENSPMLTSRGLGRLLGDLAAMGLDAQWGVLGADDVGAPHKRERIWVFANAHEMRELQPQRRKSHIGRRVGDGASKAPNVATDGRREGRTGGLDSGAPRESEQALQDADASGSGLGREQRQIDEGRGVRPSDGGGNVGWWAAEPGLVRMVHGVANRVDRIGALGNGQVPAVVRLAWETLK